MSATTSSLALLQFRIIMAKKRARDADGQTASAPDPTVDKMDEDSSDDDVSTSSLQSQSLLLKTS